MTKIRIKKILLTTGIVFISLVLILCVHIYIVTRPKAPGPDTLVMARIDLKQPITPANAAEISTWMYGQKGVDHVICNAGMDNIVFTYHPALASGNDITNNFKTALHYDHAARFIPTEAQMQSGCPVASTSITYKVYHFFRHTF